MPINRKLTRDAEAAAAKVRALKNRQADRLDEEGVLATQVEADTERIAAADAAGESVEHLVAERTRRQQRQRDLEASLSRLEQQIAEAEAELRTVEGQVAASQRDAERQAQIAKARAFMGYVHEFLTMTKPLVPELWQGFENLKRLDEVTASYMGRKVRDSESLFFVCGQVTGPPLLHVLFVLDRWAAGQPATTAVPASQPASAPDPLAERLARTAGVR